MVLGTGCVPGRAGPEAYAAGADPGRRLGCAGVTGCGLCTPRSRAAVDIQYREQGSAPCATSPTWGRVRGRVRGSVRGRVRGRVR